MIDLPQNWIWDLIEFKPDTNHTEKCSNLREQRLFTQILAQLDLKLTTNADDEIYIIRKREIALDMSSKRKTLAKEYSKRSIHHFKEIAEMDKKILGDSADISQSLIFTYSLLTKQELDNIINEQLVWLTPFYRFHSHMFPNDSGDEHKNYPAGQYLMIFLLILYPIHSQHVDGRKGEVSTFYNNEQGFFSHKHFKSYTYLLY